MENNKSVSNLVTIRDKLRIVLDEDDEEQKMYISYGVTSKKDEWAARNNLCKKYALSAPAKFST